VSREVEPSIINEYCLSGGSGSWGISYLDGNVNSTYHARFEYDSFENPLFTSINFKDIIAFLPSMRRYENNYSRFLSKNNRVDLIYDTPEGYFSNYDYNSNNLPIRRYKIDNEYNGGITYLSARYYYQGDNIPYQTLKLATKE